MLALAVACCVVAAPGPADAEALHGHVLSRTGYGSDDWSRDRIEQLGVAAYLEEQLDPASISDPAWDSASAAFPTLSMALFELLEQYEGSPFVPLLELADAKLVRSILSRRQLEQVLTDFWYDHFNVFGADGLTRLAVGPYERDAIRPHVLGRFEQMLRAVAGHAAMLFYLDNHLSSREGFVDEGGLRGLNENYARELLELHTLGANAGFDQQDVIDVARAFTGWTIGTPEVADANGFYFRAEAHDDGPKQLMGELFLPAGGGVQDGNAVLRFLANHPKTAGRICRALVQRFVAEEHPPPGLVSECAAVFLRTRGDLDAVTRSVLLSPAFRDPAHFGAKVKRPIVLIASLARATRASLTRGLLNDFLSSLDLLGELPYRARPPTGYPDLSSHWSSGGALLSQIDLVFRLLRTEVDQGNNLGVGEGTAPQLVDALAASLLAAPPEPRTRGHAIAQVKLRAAAPLEQRVRDAARVLLSSPDFLRH